MFNATNFPSALVDILQFRCFIFIHFYVFKKFFASEISSLTYRSSLFVYLLLISTLNPMLSENILRMISDLLNLPRSAQWPRMQIFSVNVRSVLRSCWAARSSHAGQVVLVDCIVWTFSIPADFLVLSVAEKGVLGPFTFWHNFYRGHIPLTLSVCPLNIPWQTLNRHTEHGVVVTGAAAALLTLSSAVTGVDC